MAQLVLALAAAPILIGLVLLGLRQPMRVTLPAYAAMLPFGGLVSVGPSRFGSASSLLGVVLGIGLVLQLVSARRTAVRLSPTIAAWLLFLGFTGATVMWSVTPDKTISGFIVLGSLVLVYVLVTLTEVDRVVLRRVENGLLLGGVVSVVYGLAQLLVLGGFPSDDPGAGVVADGRFGNDLLGPNNQAVALMLPLAISLSRSMTLPDRTKRLLHAFVAALMLAGVVMTGSRGGVLATAVVVLVLLIMGPRGRKTLLAYTAVGVVLVAVVVAFQPGGVGQREVETTSSSGRTAIWRVALAACPEYCAFGSGWGTFPDVYADTQATVADAQVLVGGEGSYEPHNVWILVAIELGVLGLLLLGTALWLGFREAWQLPVGMRAPPLAGLVATVFAALFLSNLEFKFFWMALIMVALSRNVAAREAEPAAGAATDTTAAGRR